MITYHHPKLSIPCPRAVSLLSPASEHTQGFQCMGSVASPTWTHSFPCAAPVLEAFLREKETGRGQERDSDQVNPCDCCFVLCWREERLQVLGAVILSDQMLMASPILQASEGPRCLHHSSATTKCWRLPMQAGRGKTLASVVECESGFLKIEHILLNEERSTYP